MQKGARTTRLVNGQHLRIGAHPLRLICFVFARRRPWGRPCARDRRRRRASGVRTYSFLYHRRPLRAEGPGPCGTPLAGHPAPALVTTIRHRLGGRPPLSRAARGLAGSARRPRPSSSLLRAPENTHRLAAPSVSRRACRSCALEELVARRSGTLQQPPAPRGREAPQAHPGPLPRACGAPNDLRPNVKRPTVRPCGLTRRRGESLPPQSPRSRRAALGSEQPLAVARQRRAASSEKEGYGVPWVATRARDGGQ
eukprot:scaffold135320_cov30-Tisochrysis_lutea.AAC.1